MLYVICKAETQVKAHPRVVRGKYQWVHDYLRTGEGLKAEPGTVPIVESPDHPVEHHKADIEDYVDFATEKWADKFKIVVSKAKETVEGEGEFLNEMTVTLNLYDKETSKPLAVGEGWFFTGEKGEIEVQFDYAQERLHINSVFLDEKIQGKGIGTDIIHHAIEYGLKKGLKEITLAADGDTGVYSWARMGFDYATEGSYGKANEKLVRELKDGFRQFVIKKYHKLVPPQEIQHSWQMANYEIDGKKVGKEFLLGPGSHLYYQASMNLDAYKAWKRAKGKA